MQQLGNLGSSSHQFQENNQRYIDEENDLYPPPLMTSSPTQKMTGYNKLLYAMWYLKANRVRQLLLNLDQEDFSIYETDYYGCNVIHAITSPNFPSNISYRDNKALYEQLFFVVLTNLRPTDLHKLFYDLGHKETKWGEMTIKSLLGQVKDRPHLLLALWNYGLQYSSEDVKDHPLAHFLNNNNTTDRPAGKRYHDLLDKCPISQSIIHEPAMLSDGTVYEYELIKKHLEKYDTNPITNEQLVVESQSIKRKVNNKWIGVKESVKVLYLPEKNTFEHFQLVSPREM